MPELILVHIGPIFPDYLNICVNQVKSISKISVHVLISDKHIDKVSGADKVFPLEAIPKDILQTQFESKSTLDTHFRNGFWQFASLRFFYLYNYVKMVGLKDVFHIEYDNLVYYDIFDNLAPFQTKEMWCVMDSPNKCIPSFLYFKNGIIIEALLKIMIESTTRRLNDMQSLAYFYYTNRERVGSLPIIKDYREPIDPLYYESAELFGFLFDGCCVGQYVGGVDPRNIGGNTIGYINDTSVIQCNKMTVAFVDKKPVLNGMPLVNLHIHAKDLIRWKSY